MRCRSPWSEPSGFNPRWLLVVPLLCGTASHADEVADLALGKQLFVNGAAPACALCHTLKDAGAAGAVGPSLDDLKPDAERVKKAITSGIGQMPAFTTLTERKVQAIARYVERATGAAK